MVRRTLLAMAGCLVLCGCVDDKPYPADWAAPVKAEGCANVAGLYRSRSEGSDLYQTLLPDATTPADAGKMSKISATFDRVEIASDGPKALVARFGDATGVLETLHLSERECGREGVIIVVYSGMTSEQGNPIVGYERQAVTLNKAADGALIARRSESDTGMVYMFLPVSAGGSHWERFPAIAGH
jgi:hypothetical protein